MAFCQLTHRENYCKADTELGFRDAESCEWHAENALDPTKAARIGYRGMVEGWFRSGETLPVYFTDVIEDPYGARGIINGDKKTIPKWSNGVSIGHLIEGYYDDFLAAIRAAWVTPPVA